MEKPEGYIFLADAHLNSFDEHTEAFISLLRECSEKGVEVYLLGDIFDLWFGKETLTLPFQEEVIREFATLSEKGLKINYIEGNRDFFLVDSWVQKYFAAISDNELDIKVGEKSILLLHGDTVNRHDLQYRFWKFLSKNTLVFSLFSAIPAGLALTIAGTFERKLKKTNPRFRYNFPEDQGKAFATNLFGKGYDMVIIGHYHQENIITYTDYGPDKLLICLPMWRENRRYFYIGRKENLGFRSYSPGLSLID